MWCCPLEILHLLESVEYKIPVSKPFEPPTISWLQTSASDLWYTSGSHGLTLLRTGAAWMLTAIAREGQQQVVPLGGICSIQYKVASVANCGSKVDSAKGMLL